MNCDKNDIVITGMAAILPNGPASSLIGAKPFDITNSAVERKLKRCSAQSALYAVEASERAMKMADVLPRDEELRWGFYTGQNGYQHPDFSDLVPALSNVQTQTPTDILPRLWASRKVNPFLLTCSLSNNLLGILSLHWKLKGDCGAFIRDEIGVAAALQEAVFGLTTRVCNIALVVNAGTHADWLSRDCSATSKQMLRMLDDNVAGACALVLERREHAEKRSFKTIAKLTLLPSRYQRPNKSLRWLFDALPTAKVDLFMHELKSDKGCTDDIQSEVEMMLKPEKNINLFDIQPNKGCEGLALSVLVASQLGIQTTQTHPVRHHQSLVINSSKNNHVSAALVEGQWTS